MYLYKKTYGKNYWQICSNVRYNSEQAKEIKELMPKDTVNFYLF